MTYNPINRGVPTISRAASRLTANNSGVLIAKATPVRVTSTGLALIDVSVESQVNGVAGLTNDAVSNASQGEVISGGLIEDITTSAAVGEPVYISKTGVITNIKPSVGSGGFVSGDWAIRVGVIAKNNNNPLLKDILVNIQIVGQL